VFKVLCLICPDSHTKEFDNMPKEIALLPSYSFLLHFAEVFAIGARCGRSGWHSNFRPAEGSSWTNAPSSGSKTEMLSNHSKHHNERLDENPLTQYSSDRTASKFQSQQTSPLGKNTTVV
jgi:hypothetical protein